MRRGGIRFVRHVPKAIRRRTPCRSRQYPSSRYSKLHLTSDVASGTACRTADPAAYGLSQTLLHGSGHNDMNSNLPDGRQASN